MTARLPTGAGPASPSTVTMAPSGHTCMTRPTCSDVSVDHGPVPYRTASPGDGAAHGGSTPVLAWAQVYMYPVKAYDGTGTPACCHTHVANSEHHASHGPYGLQKDPVSGSAFTWLVAVTTIAEASGDGFGSGGLAEEQLNQSGASSQ